MKRLLTLLMFFILSATGCNAANNSANGSTDTLNTKDKTEALSIVPFNERRFIYTNSLEDKTKQASEKVDGISIQKSYPVINGLINKELQSKLNSAILNTLEQNLKNLETEVKGDASLNPYTNRGESSSACIIYNCNNVIFVEYYANMDLISKSESAPKQKIKSLGYDLNTGNILELKDLFKQDSNYKKFINDFISLYIINKNYDDPDGNLMIGPFKGIREEQSFSFDLSGLRIILDEKNDEFVNRGNQNSITIPLKTVGPNLAIFDRYYQEKTNLFQKKTVKKLLPNQVEFKANNLIQESKGKYSIYVEKGEFINLENEETKKLLNDFVMDSQDTEGFKARAEASKENWYGSLGHNINLVMNSGGFLSVMVQDYQNEKGREQELRRYLNYDLENNKIIKLKNIFSPSFDYKKAISAILTSNPDYTKSQAYTFKQGDISKLSEENFYFNEESVTIYLNLTGRKEFQNYFTIPFDKIGYANIALYQ